MYYRFRLSKDGQIFSVTTPEGIINYNDAVSTLVNYEPYQILFYETISEDTSRNSNSGGGRGLFGLW